MTSNRQLNPVEESNRIKTAENTLNFIETYLEPKRKLDNGITLKQHIYRIGNADVSWKAVSNYIKDMDYRDFLKTPYWKVIAAYTKQKAGYRCQLCNSTRHLATHHRNYGIHGLEHAHLQELTVLCKACHDRFHERLPKSQF